MSEIPVEAKRESGSVANPAPFTFPSKWATVEIAFGEKRRHFYCPDEHSLSFHRTEGDARAAASHEIDSGTKMIAILRIDTVLTARPEYDEHKAGT